MTMTAYGAAADPRPPTILVVEDEVLLRMDIADEFAAAGFSVLEAGTADEALALIEGGTPVDLVFSDIQTPGAMDGLGLHRVLRQRFPRIVVVLTSAHATPAAMDDLAFIPKPYAPRAALRRFETELRRRRVAGGPPRDRGAFAAAFQAG